MNLLTRINCSVKTGIFILFLSILFVQSTSFASPIEETRVVNKQGDKLLVQLIIDTEGKNPSIEIGSRLDHKLMNVSPVDFLEYLDTRTSHNTIKGNRRIVYILSKRYFTPIKFSIVLKIFLGDEGPFMEKVDIDMTKAIKPGSRRKNKKERKLTGFSVSGSYRLALRGIKVGGTKVNSKIKLALFNIEKTFFNKRFGVFINLGSGILQLDNGVQFTSLNPSHTLTKYDGGRSFVIGGGLKGKIFEKKAMRVDIIGSVLSFNSEASSVTQKTIKDKAESALKEYKADLLLTLTPIRFIKPYAGVSYSIIGGEIKISQTFGKSGTTTQTKSFDEKNGFGVVFGFALFPYKGIKVVVEGRLLNEMGLTGRLGWMF